MRAIKWFGFFWLFLWPDYILRIYICWRCRRCPFFFCLRDLVLAFVFFLVDISDFSFLSFSLFFSFFKIIIFYPVLFLQPWSYLFYTWWRGHEESLEKAPPASNLHSYYNYLHLAACTCIHIYLLGKKAPTLSCSISIIIRHWWNHFA